MDFGDVFGSIIDVVPYSRFFYYKGQKTFPNCDGIVNWYVFENSFAVDEDDYNGLLVDIMDVVGDDASIGNAKPAIYGELDRLKRGGCYIGYWTHDMGSNFGVFYMIPFMIIFFATTLVWDTEMPLRHMERYKNYLWVIYLLFYH